jgi:hypothetical protein
MFAAGDLNGGYYYIYNIAPPLLCAALFVCLCTACIFRVWRFDAVCVYLYPQTQTALIWRFWAAVGHGPKYPFLPFSTMVKMGFIFGSILGLILGPFLLSPSAERRASPQKS